MSIAFDIGTQDFDSFIRVVHHILYPDLKKRAQRKWLEKNNMDNQTIFRYNQLKNNDSLWVMFKSRMQQGYARLLKNSKLNMNLA